MCVCVYIVRRRERGQGSLDWKSRTRMTRVGYVCVFAYRTMLLLFIIVIFYYLLSGMIFLSRVVSNSPPPFPRSSFDLFNHFIISSIHQFINSSYYLYGNAVPLAISKQITTTMEKAISGGAVRDGNAAYDRSGETVSPI